MHLDKLNTRKNLHRKGILNSPFCPRCPLQIEDKMHLFFDCPVAQHIWQRAGIQPLHSGLANIWKMSPSVHLPPSTWPTVLLTILWKIWDTRNGLVFRNQVISPQHSVSNVISYLSLWLYRFKKPNLKEDAMSWRDHLSACRSNLQT
jgi:hypothetical protein